MAVFAGGNGYKTGPLTESHKPHTGHLRAPYSPTDRLCGFSSNPVRHPHGPVCVPYGTRRVHFPFYEFLRPCGQTLL